MTNEPQPEVFEALQARMDATRSHKGVDPTLVDGLQNRLTALRLFHWDNDSHKELAAIERDLDEAIQVEPDTSSWSEPQPLSEDVLAPHLSTDLIPIPLRPWLVDAAERMSVPIEMVTVPVLVALGAALGRAVALYPKRHGNWRVVANLWGVVVAPSSAMKTPALEEGTRPLERIAAEAIAVHESTRFEREAELSILQAKLAKLNSLARSSTAPATLASDIADAKEGIEKLLQPARRFMTSDSTVEMLTELLRRNPRGLLVLRDELAGLLVSYDKQGREGDREFYLEAFNSKENYTVDRIGRGTIHVPAVTLSIVGGIQPGKMEGIVLGAVSGRREADGLLQRFQLAVYPQRLSEYTHVDRPVDTAAYERSDRLFALLADFSATDHPELEFGSGSLPGLRFEENAQNAFDEWLIAHMNRLRSGELDSTPAFQAHLGKYSALVVKLALLFHMLDTIETGYIPPVSVEALRLAIDWVEYLEAHARKIYAPELQRMPENVRELALRIQEGEVPDGTSVRDVYRRGWRGLKTPAAVLSAAKHLATKGWVRVEKSTTNGRGRPSDTLRINPELPSLNDELDT